MKEYVRILRKEYRQSFRSIEEFVDIQNDIINSEDERYVVSLEETEYIADGLMAILGTYPELSKKYDCTVAIRSRKDSRTKEQLIKSGVLQYYRDNRRKFSYQPKDQKSISFCNPADLEEYLDVVKKMMELAPVKFDSEAYAKMTSKLYEVFNNAITHGQSDLGVFTHGDIRKDKFIFSVYDLGIGIQKNVNTYLGRELSGQEAMEWALESGHSTLNSTIKVDYPRGAGFTLLSSFVEANGGVMFLCSDNVICKIEHGKKVFHKMKNRILGTLLIMNIRTDDDNIYRIRRK